MQNIFLHHANFFQIFFSEPPFKIWIAAPGAASAAWSIDNHAVCRIFVTLDERIQAAQEIVETYLPPRGSGREPIPHLFVRDILGANTWPMPVGAIALTRMLKRPHSTAALRVRPRIAPLFIL